MLVIDLYPSYPSYPSLFRKYNNLTCGGLWRLWRVYLSLEFFPHHALIGSTS